MVDRDLKPRSPVKDFVWLALFLIVLGVIWFAQGGPSRLSSSINQGPFIEPSGIFTTPSSQEGEKSISSGGGVLPFEEKKPPVYKTLLEESRYKGHVFLSAPAAWETDPAREYLEIYAAYNAESTRITDWKLEGKEGLAVSIGAGAFLVYSAQVNPQEPIYLKSGNRAIIVSGKSPIGTNFRLNICTGYFNQFQEFTPYLSQECPNISVDDMPINFPDVCFDFIRTLWQCRMPLVIPPAAGNDCVNFIGERANYNGCVALHKNDKDFYKNEWRIYLGREKELWQKRDTIILLDEEGKIVDKVSYY